MGEFPDARTMNWNGITSNSVAAAATPLENQLDFPVASDMEGGDFVNNGFRRWQVARDEWCGHNKFSSDGGNTSTSAGDISLPRSAVPIDVDEVIDVLLDPRWRAGVVQTGGKAGGNNKKDGEPPRFPQNVPLPQMIDVLVDLWEAEGLDI